jgi:hypothetical protein
MSDKPANDSARRPKPGRSRYGWLLVISIWTVVLIGAMGFLLVFWGLRSTSATTVAFSVLQNISSKNTFTLKAAPADPAPAATPTPFQADPTAPPNPSPTPNLEPIAGVPTRAAPTPTPRPFTEGPLVIGYSVEERPLEVFRFGTGPDVRVMIAGIHGGYEWNTVALAEALIGHLRAHPELVPDRVTLYILRVMNPDGLARGQWYEGRLNENGVDLNRNFPANWQAEWPNEGCWGHLVVSSGTGPGSEPETQAVMDFVSRYRVTALISYHSAALGVFPGGIPLHLPSVQLAQDISAVTTYPYPPYETGCLYTGTLADWAAHNGIAAVDLELHTHGDLDFVENLDVLSLLLNWQPDNLSGR